MVGMQSIIGYHWCDMMIIRDANCPFDTGDISISFVDYEAGGNPVEAVVLIVSIRLKKGCQCEFSLSLRTRKAHLCHDFQAGLDATFFKETVKEPLFFLSYHFKLET
ncbi:hypothetical protein ACROYT_G036383 [Oculina patagonica]